MAKQRSLSSADNFSFVLADEDRKWDAVEEVDTGDYYPRWLENFVLALLNPIPEPGKFTSGSLSAQRSQDGICLQRNDRPGGITDQLTWGHVCFTGSTSVVSSILTFNQYVTFSDWQKFETQRIARQYETDVRDYQKVTARLNRLDKWTPDKSLLRVEHPASADQRLDTRFVSTLTEEGMLERAPQIAWPSVREGKTEGYMIVYARTDRTGQVRETAKHNSDQPGLEEFGMQQALLYKFKPLVVDGVAKQMEMPLVLHFTSTLADSVPVLSAQEMKKQMGSCSMPKVPSQLQHGASMQVEISIDETGKLTGSRPLDASGTLWLTVIAPLRDCRFAPLVRDGKPTYYKGILELKP